MDCCGSVIVNRLELLRQAQEKDGDRGIELTGKQPAAIELIRRDHSTGIWAQFGGGRVPPHFLLGIAFGEVSKLNVTFVTFCVKSFSC